MIKIINMKGHTTLAIILVLLGSCAQNNEQAKTLKNSNSPPYNRGNIIFNKLLKAFNQSANNVVALFHQEATIEFPYAPSLGTASKLSLHEYLNYLEGGLPTIPDINFENMRVYAVNKNAYWAEVHGSVQIPSTGKFYQQDYVMYFTLKGDKIDFYREYWDPIAAMKAFGGPEAIKETFDANN